MKTSETSIRATPSCHHGLLAALVVCALFVCQPMAVQGSAQGWPGDQPVAVQASPRGWPDGGGAKAAVPAAPVAKKVRAPIAKPAKVTDQAKATESPKVIESAKPIDQAKTTDSTGESASSIDVMQALRQQSDLLAGLIVELQGQRAVIFEQQQKIEAMYERRDANWSALAACVTVAAPAPSVAGLAVPVSSTVDADTPSAPSAGTGPSAPRSAAVQGGDANLLKRIRHRLLSSLASTP